MSATVRVLIEATLHDEDNRVETVEAGSAVLLEYADLEHMVSGLLREIADEFERVHQQIEEEDR